MSKKRKNKVPILSRAEKLKKKLGIKMASLKNRLVDAETRKPPPKIDPAFIPFKPRGLGRVVPGTGSNLSQFRKK